MVRESGIIAAARSLFLTPDHRAWLGIDAPVPGLMTERFDRDLALCGAMIADGLALGVPSFFTDIESLHPRRTGPAYDGFAALGFRPGYLRTHFVPA